MEIKDIIDYVEKTPANTNPNVLSGMLEDLEGKKLSEFTLDYYSEEDDIYTTFFFEEGMTWYDFTGSKYCPTIQYDPLIRTDEDEVLYIDNTRVKKNKEDDYCTSDE